MRVYLVILASMFAINTAQAGDCDFSNTRDCSSPEDCAAVQRAARDAEASCKAALAESARERRLQEAEAKAAKLAADALEEVQDAVAPPTNETTTNTK